MVQESVASVALPYLEVTFTFLLTNLSKGSGKALEKLKRLFIETLMSDAEYDALDLFPDFEKEDMDAE